MIVVELTFVCDGARCANVVTMPNGSIISASDREQVVCVPSDLPPGWTLDSAGNIYCASHLHIKELNAHR